MCPSSQSLYFSPLRQVVGRALAPSLHPNRAPATAPLVSASPPWKQHQTTERSVTSRYHGSKISGSQQSFLTETAICIIERWKKSMGYSLFLSLTMHREVIHVKSLFVCLFSSIFAGQQFMEITRSCATMLTWRNDFSSLEAICSYSLTWAARGSTVKRKTKEITISNAVSSLFYSPSAPLALQHGAFVPFKPREWLHYMLRALQLLHECKLRAVWRIYTQNHACKILHAQLHEA